MSFCTTRCYIGKCFYEYKRRYVKIVFGFDVGKGLSSHEMEKK